MYRYEGKRVIVTGASRGIGASIAKRFILEGAKVALCYHSFQGGAQQVARYNKSSNSFVFCLSVSERASILALVEEVISRFGGIDILVNNAGIAQEKPYMDITDDDWDKMMAVNLRGPFALSQEVLPHMISQKWGRIVNIASIGGQWGGKNQIHYAVAKAGLIGLTRSLAKTFSGEGVTINAVSPGLIASDMVAQELETEAGKQKVACIPAGRIGTPKEVATIVEFLCSDEASYITGQTLNANGGMYFS
jgi:NAD(P)-dependent dehydrogenase (short-subunit alcohol dehydrogenase family)